MSPIKTISAKMLDYFVGQPDAWIIDLREHSVYERSHIKGAVNVPYEELEGDMHFQRISSLFFTATEEVQVWQLPESLPEEGIKQAL